MPFPDQLQTSPPPVTANPFVFPDEITAGDSIKLTVHSDLYPPGDGWVLSYSLRGDAGDGTRIDLAAATSGSDFVLIVLPSVTVLWNPTDYAVAAFVTNAGLHLRTQVFEGFTQILVNLPNTNAAVDTRTHARRVLDAIEAVLEGRATNDILDSTIDNTMFKRLTPEQLTQMHSYYSAKVRSEIAKTRVKAGLGSGRNIFVRFTQPS